ncbi:MAG: glycoside hydrolase family 10 protein [Vicinamibacterales bacterium]
MLFTGTAFARRFAGAALVVCLAVAVCGTQAPSRVGAQSPPSITPEMRALWVLRTSLVSPESITTLVQSAKLHGFNALFVQVRGRGDAYYKGGIEPRGAELARQPEDFDPLAEVLRAAHAAGLRVHAWINVNLVSSATELPRAREHLVYRHPEWLMVPRALALELARMDPASPGYVGKLARWTRTQSADVEGLYASPVSAAAVSHLSAVVAGIVRRYPVDGVHFDYARYPTNRFDYSRTAIREFRVSIQPRLPIELRRNLAAREKDDRLAFPDALPDEWRRFRVDRMTSLMARLRTAVKTERPAAPVSVAASADMHEAIEQKLQDWPRWIEEGLIDAVAPMAYTTEPARFAEQIAAARVAAGNRQVWAGIGAYRLSPAQTIDNIATARRLGAGGVILFSYDSLIDPRQSARGYLAAVARGAFQ